MTNIFPFLANGGVPDPAVVFCFTAGDVGLTMLD
jgi:hypothetical protein